jgi:hypothetical protein
LGVCTKRFSAAQGTCQMSPPRILAGRWSWGSVPEFPAKATRNRVMLLQHLLFAGHHMCVVRIMLQWICASLFVSDLH